MSCMSHEINIIHVTNGVPIIFTATQFKDRGMFGGSASVVGTFDSRRPSYGVGSSGWSGIRGTKLSQRTFRMSTDLTRFLVGFFGQRNSGSKETVRGVSEV